VAAPLVACLSDPLLACPPGVDRFIITETNRAHCAPFGMQNRATGPFLMINNTIFILARGFHPTAFRTAFRFGVSHASFALSTEFGALGRRSESGVLQQVLLFSFLVPEAAAPQQLSCVVPGLEGMRVMVVGAWSWQAVHVHCSPLPSKPRRPSRLRQTRNQRPVTGGWCGSGSRRLALRVCEGHTRVCLSVCLALHVRGGHMLRKPDLPVPSAWSRPVTFVWRCPVLQGLGFRV
jgi:hypothetical protein